MNKYIDNIEYKEHKIISNKTDCDLFDDEKNILTTIIRIKLTATNKNEKWRIYQDNNIVFTIDGCKLSKKEREYLRTADGFNFLIKQFKSGIKSINKVRVALKQII